MTTSQPPTAETQPALSVAGDDRSFYLPVDAPAELQAELAVILDALAVADCNCDPGDGTCEDWRNRDHRILHLGHAISWKLRQVREHGGNYAAPIPGTPAETPEAPAPEINESTAVAWADLVYLRAREAAEDAREGDEPLSLMVGLAAAMDALIDAGHLPAVVPASLTGGQR